MPRELHVPSADLDNPQHKTEMPQRQACMYETSVLCDKKCHKQTKWMESNNRYENFNTASRSRVIAVTLTIIMV